jgi:hypothetical protein
VSAPGPRYRLWAAAGTAAVAFAVGAGAGAYRLGWFSRGSAPHVGPVRDPGAPSGGEPDAYAASVVRRYEAGGSAETSETRVARRGDWARSEWSEGPRRFASIARPDLGVVWLVDLDRNVYVERRTDAPVPSETGLTGEQVEALAADSGGGGVTTSSERAGEETVDGHPCVVYKTRAESPLGGASESTVWEAQDLGGLAIRSETKGPDGARVTTELRDVRSDAPASLFELPPGASRAEAL